MLVFKKGAYAPFFVFFFYNTGWVKRKPSFLRELNYLYFIQFASVELFVIEMLNTIKLLIQILSDGNFHSDLELEKVFNLTRNDILQFINHLNQYGIEVETKIGLGYRIPGGLELINKNFLGEYLNSKYQSRLENTVVFDEVSSTNTYLSDLLRDKENKINICFAEYQTAGKGRLGRQWISPYAKNIYLSLLHQFIKQPLELSGLSIAVAVATVKALKLYGLQDEIRLKWPNDIVWQGRKLVGILIELFAKSHNSCNAVIGVGVNVNMSQKQGNKIDQPWCDVAEITNSIPQRNKLAGILLDQLLTAIDLFQEYGLQAFIKDWMNFDVCYEKSVKIITPTKVFSGIGMGIDGNGHFLLQDATGKTHTFASGEVSLRVCI